MKLAGTSCVITGAARGLGAALAREARVCGMNAYLSDIDGKDLRELADELHMPAAHCDVTNHGEVRRLAQAARKKFGSVDVWINNAGVWMPYTSAETLDFARAHKLMEVNYFGLAHSTVEAMKIMRRQKRGIIVNILSVRALQGKALGAAYSASKFAAEGFTQAIRGELEGSGVSVINIYPYRIKTTLFGQNKHEDYATSMEPSDVARVVFKNLTGKKPSTHLEIWGMKDIRRR